MALDTARGFTEHFEDFDVTAIADLPEIDIQAVTGDTIALVAGGDDGRIRLTAATSNDDDVGAITFGALNWKAGGGDLYASVRVELSSITDNKFFIGFGDSVASADETSFDATADVVDILTMTDGIGLLFDNDATTKQFWAVAGKTDVATVGYGLGTASWSNIAITTMHTFGVWLSQDRRSARWYIDGKEVYALDSPTTLVGAVALVPGLWTYEQGTACAYDVDYIHARKARATT